MFTATSTSVHALCVDFLSSHLKCSSYYPVNHFRKEHSGRVRAIATGVSVVRGWRSGAGRSRWAGGGRPRSAKLVVFRHKHRWDG